MQTTGCARLDEDLAAFGSLVTLAPRSARELEDALKKASAVVATADFGAYDADAIRTGGREALDDMFEIRIALRDRIPAWTAFGFMTRPVQSAMRGVFRDGRYATDMLGEIIAGFPDADDAPAMTAFTGDPMQTIVNPRYGNDGEVSFRSGDLLLVRGMAANSAAIARIGDIDSQFSHIGVVHVDAAGEPWVVEALIEKGATVTPMREALNHGLARAVLFRPRDEELGAAAAALVRAHVERSTHGPLPRIPYDFSMELRGYDELFCSKLVRLAYASASDGGLVLPSFNTRLDMANRDFFRRIGVTAIETFAPADVEMEPAFDIVAEWRDWRRTALVRNQDVVMDAIFWWMEEYGYVFKETLGIRLIGLLGRLSAHLPHAITSLVTTLEVPMNMKRSTIEAIAMLHKTSKPLVDELMALERTARKNHGRPMHPREAFAHLEHVRVRSKGRIGHLQTDRPHG